MDSESTAPIPKAKTVHSEAIEVYNLFTKTPYPDHMLCAIANRKQSLRAALFPSERAQTLAGLTSNLPLSVSPSPQAPVSGATAFTPFTQKVLQAF